MESGRAVARGGFPGLDRTCVVRRGPGRYLPEWHRPSLLDALTSGVHHGGDPVVSCHSAVLWLVHTVVAHSHCCGSGLFVSLDFPPLVVSLCPCWTGLLHEAGVAAVQAGAAAMVAGRRLSPRG